MAICFLVAGVVAPWLAAKAATAQEAVARQHHSGRDVAAMLALEHAPELRVGGTLPSIVLESQRQQRDWSDAIDAATRPAALATAVPTAAIGASVLGATVAAIGLAGAVAPTTLAILMLLPLSAFEATTPLAAAAVQWTRSRIAARHLLDLAPAEKAVVAPQPRCTTATASPHPAATAALRAHDVSIAHGGGRDTGTTVSLELKPGARLAVTGPSGSGKTTLLMTLAGLLTPKRGEVTLGGTPLQLINELDLRCAVGFFAEDAHVFATSVRDNLLVARGDSPDGELAVALEQVGLGAWLLGLPDGLDTVLAAGPDALSAGQRRRLLLARAIISPARIVLLDEPTEHLDAADAEPVLRRLLDPHGGLIAAERTVVVATHHLPDRTGCSEIRICADEYSDRESPNAARPESES
jgi:ATP-binding cassette subfamily C protein CydC